MDQNEFPKLLVEYIDFYEGNQFEIVEQDRGCLDQSEDIISDFIEMFNESLHFKDRDRIMWLLFRYGARDNFRLIFEWINHGLSTSNSQVKLDNLGESQENILKFLIENELISQIQIEDLIKKLKRREIGGYPDRPRKLLEFHLENLSGKSSKNIPKPVLHKNVNSLVDLIAHEKAYEIVVSIKTSYKNIKGKRLKLLLIALHDLALLPKDRIAKKFHDACKQEFEWDIASYNAMNMYKFNSHIDNEELVEMKESIKRIITPN